MRALRRALGWALALGALGAAAPLWLPTALGGETTYTYILTESMLPTFGRGTFVVLRPAPEVPVGQVGGYWLEVEEGRRVIIVHRVVGRTPNGDYLFQGDANPTAETVPAEDLLGRVVLAVPYLGYGLMAFQAAPHLFALMAVGALVVGAAYRAGAKQRRAPTRPFPWFWVALGAVALSAPMAEVGLVERFGLVPMVGLMVAMLVVLRGLERSTDDPVLRSLVELNYLLVMALAVAGVPVLRILQDLRTLLAG